LSSSDALPAVPRDHVIRVLAAFADVERLSNYWIRISKPSVILEQTYFQLDVIPSVIVRFADRLGIPHEYFWDEALFEEMMKQRDAETAPLPTERAPKPHRR